MPPRGGLPRPVLEELAVNGEGATREAAVGDLKTTLGNYREAIDMDDFEPLVPSGPSEKAQRELLVCTGWLRRPGKQPRRQKHRFGDLLPDDA